MPKKQAPNTFIALNGPVRDELHRHGIWCMVLHGSVVCHDGSGSVPVAWVFTPSFGYWMYDCIDVDSDTYIVSGTLAHGTTASAQDVAAEMMLHMGKGKRRVS